MKTTKEGWAILEGDTHFSKWIKETGEIDHGQKHAERWKTLLPTGGVGVDIGANLGDTAIPMGRLVGPTGRVYAFEPNPLAFECLEHNIKNARLDGIIIPFQFGAASSNQSNVPFCCLGNVGASHVIADNTDTTSYIELRRLDDVLPDLTRLDFVKIDVEGMEIQALKGMAGTIERFKPVIQMEVSNHSVRYGLDKQKVLAWMLVRFGYAPEISVAEILAGEQLDVLFRPSPCGFSGLTSSVIDALNYCYASHNAKTEEREGQRQDSRRSEVQGLDSRKCETTSQPASGSGARVETDGEDCKRQDEARSDQQILNSQPNPDDE